MGGRGAASASSSGGSDLKAGDFTGLGSKEVDNLVNEALKKYKDIEIKNKLQENMAKRFLGNDKDPVAVLKERLKKALDFHDNDLRDSKNYKKDLAAREKYAKEQSDLAIKYSNEDKKRTAYDVRGREYQKESVRAERQMFKAVQLNKGISAAISEQKVREKRINEFKSSFAKKVDSEVKRAALASAYLKKNKK